MSIGNLSEKQVIIQKLFNLLKTWKNFCELCTCSLEVELLHWMKEVRKCRRSFILALKEIFLRESWKVRCLSVSSAKFCFFVLFKGKVSRDGYFLSLTFLSVLIVYALMVSRSFKSFHFPYTIINFFASLKIDTNFENSYWTETLLIIPFSVIVQCSPVLSTPYWLQGKCARINLQRRLPVWLCRITSGFLFSVKVATLVSLLKEFSKLMSNFKGAS